MADRIVPGSILSGQYELIGKLSAGGMGVVCKAKDIELGTPVALKFISSKLAANKMAVERLRREATIGQQLAHRNICRLYGLHSHKDVRFIVMEFVAGKTLDRMLSESDGHKLSWEELEPIALQMADALDYAHNAVYTDSSGRQVRGVLHRDIKPSNIMITPDGSAKLVDFGIAREMKDNMTRVTGEETPGTLLYMSPEQYLGKRLTTASDIYSFAATLYECLSGHPPFHQGAINHQLLKEHPESIAGAPAHINAALRCGLGKKPESRPATARDLVKLLQGKTPRQRSKKATSIVAALLAVVAIGAVAVFGGEHTAGLRNWVFGTTPEKEAEPPSMDDSPAIVPIAPGSPANGTNEPDQQPATQDTGSADDQVLTADTEPAGNADDADTKTATPPQIIEDNTRELAEQALQEAEQARRRGEAAGVEEMVPDAWRDLEAFFAAAKDDLDKKNYTTAREALLKAKEKYAGAARVAEEWSEAEKARDQAIAARNRVEELGADKLAPAAHAAAKRIDEQAGKDFGAGELATAIEGWHRAEAAYLKMCKAAEPDAASEPEANAKYLAARNVMPALLERFGGEAFKQAEKMANNGSSREALRLLDDAKEAAGRGLNDAVARARKLYEGKKHDDAMKIVQQVIALQPREKYDNLLLEKLFNEALALKRQILHRAPYRLAKELGTGGHLVLCVACSPDGKMAAAGCFDNVIKLWGLATGEALDSIAPGHVKEQITCVDFSPDGKRIVSGCWGNTIVLSEVGTGKSFPLPAAFPHTAQVNSVRFSKCGRYVVSGSYDTTIKIWDVSRGAEKLISTLTGSAREIASVAFSLPEKTGEKPRFVVSGGFGGTVRVWDVEKAECIWTGIDHPSVVNSVCFSPDGRLIASGSRDNTVKIWRWNGEAGKLLATLEGHAGDVTSAVFSPEGRQVLSGSHDGTIRLWDVTPLQDADGEDEAAAQPRLLQSMQYDAENATEVLSVAFSPDARSIIAAGRDTVKIWAQGTGNAAP